MKFRLLIVTLVALLITSFALAQDAIVKWREGWDDQGGEKRIGFRYPMPVQEQPIEKFLASSSVEIGTTAAVRCPTLNTYTRVLLVGPIGNPLNWADRTVPTGIYPFAIASGSYKAFNVTTSTPDIWFRAQSASATVHFLEF